MRRALMVGVAGLALTAACGAPTVEEAWAAESDRYFAAMDEAGDRATSERMLRFYAEGVRLDSWRNAGFSCEGAEECLGWVVGRFGATTDETSTGDLYLDTEGAVREVRNAWASGVARELAVMEFDADGRIVLELQPRSLETVAPTLGADVASVRRAAAVTHLDAWTSLEPATVGARYAEGAVVVDRLLGLRLAGRAAVEAHVRASRFLGGLSTARALVSPGAAPVVYLHLSEVQVDPDAEHRLYVVHDADDGTGCPGRAVTALTIRGGLVEYERRYHEVDAVRRCLDRASLPVGWWTGLDPPPPLADELTGAVLVGGQRIEVHNGTPALEGFVRWGFAQVAAAGLPLPQVALVGFDRDVHQPQCPRERDGCCFEGTTGTEIYVCGGEAEICTDSECGTFSTRWRHLLLHEIAHAWMFQHLDALTAEQFLRQRDLLAWYDVTLPWQERGVEQAAEVLAWGWMDQPIALHRLGAPPCEELAQAFRTLTGTAPHRTCELDTSVFPSEG